MGQESKLKGCQLSSLTISHIEFLDDLVRVNALTKDDAVELFELGLRETPAEFHFLLLPFNKIMYEAMIDYLKNNYKIIAIYIDENGKRYISPNPE